MKKGIKRWICIVLLAALLVTLLPAGVIAAEGADIWTQIENFENARLRKKRSAGEMPTAADYAALSGEVAELVKQSASYAPGTCTYDGTNDMFFWEDLDGIAYGYDPEMRRMLSDRSKETPEGTVTRESFAKRGPASSARIYVLEPWYNIQDNGAFYENEIPYDAGKMLAKAIGGTVESYRGNRVTIDVLAEAVENGVFVMIATHGGTDYLRFLGETDLTGAEIGDRATRANSSYLTLNSTEGLTDEDFSPSAENSERRATTLICSDRITAKWTAR